MPANPKARETKATARRHFEKWALSYDRSRLNELVFYPCIRACQEEILRWRRQFGRDTYRVLDVGCGTGTLLCMLSHDSAAERLVGLDYSTAMAERAGKKFAEHDAVHRLEAVEGDAEHLPFEDESFDVVTCCNSFHHYPHQDQALANFHRVLRPGGLLLLLDGFRDNVLGWLIFDVAVAWVEKHVHHVSWSEARRLIEGAGFRDLQQRKMNVLAPVLVNRALRWEAPRRAIL